jgi:LytS/YehU family sensor histidine kinase
MNGSHTSSPILPVSWQKGEFRTLLVIIGVCCWVGVFLALQQPASLASNLITANAIGLSQWMLVMLTRLFFGGRLHVWAVALAIPAGWVLGSKLASLTGGADIASLMIHQPATMRQAIMSAILIAVAITAFFLYFSHTRGVREELERERGRAAEALQTETQARLALLQAQIEPHFLFNTLANIQSLIEQQPDTARLILENLNSYLPTSLRRTRQSSSTLGEELDLVEALLAIAAARLGPRLEYGVSAPDELRSCPLPPLLLQPLVENAILHGVEPAVTGGKIQVDASWVGDGLELKVADTGIGLNENAPQGVGLTNVRARLASLYGKKGTLAVYANVPRGVVAKLTVPATL